MNICKDCDFFRNRWAQYFATMECIHPNAAYRVGGLVTGYKREFSLCEKMREDESKCGQEGKWFAPRRSAIERWLDFS